MACELRVYGPAEIPTSPNERGTKIIDKDCIDRFWNGAHASDVTSKQGCYIFAKRAGKGFTPIYVGKTSKNFKQEIFTSHKLGHYNAALHNASHGTPVMFFVARPGTRSKIPAKVLEHLELELIQYAKAKNPHARNIQKTKAIPEWSIQGVIRSPRGRRPVAAVPFQKMMGM